MLTPTLHSGLMFVSKFNKGELYIPDKIATKSIGINGDIAEVLQ